MLILLKEVNIIRLIEKQKQCGTVATKNCKEVKECESSETAG